MSSDSVLTSHQLQVLTLMADGMTNAEISRMLWLSENTVKSIAKRIYARLGARNRHHAVAIGFRTGLLS